MSITTLPAWKPILPCVRPAQAVRVALFAQRMPWPVLMSSALAPGSAIVVATNVLASSVEPVLIDATKSVSIQAEDTAPAAIVSPGGQVAAPHHSIWQKDGVALRMKLPATWTVRDALARFLDHLAAALAFVHLDLTILPQR
jgi:hypothetical protein